MKKKFKIAIIVTAILITVGLSSYYFIAISKPWYLVSNTGNYQVLIDDNSSLLLDNGTLIFGDERQTLQYFDLPTGEDISSATSFNVNVSVKQKIEIQNDLLYTIDNTGINHHLFIVNISNRENQGMISNFSTNNFIWDFEIHENILFLVSADSLFILNITNPANPSLILRYSNNLFFGVHGLSYFNNQLFIANNIHGVLVLDITNMSNPNVITEITDYKYYGDTPANEAMDVIANEDLILILDLTHGLAIYNRTAENQFTYLSTIWASGDTYKFVYADPFVYIAGGNVGFKLLDIHDPLNPFLVDRVDELGSIYDIAVFDEGFYITSDYGISSYEIVDGEGPNPIEKAVAIDVITAVLQTIAYITLAIILVLVVKRSKTL